MYNKNEQKYFMFDKQTGRKVMHAVNSKEFAVKLFTKEEAKLEARKHNFLGFKNIKQEEAYNE